VFTPLFSSNRFLMPRRRALDAIADRITATDHDIIHATQEAVYFFFVVFLVDLQLWPHSRVSVALGCLLILLAFFRILYYLVPYFLQHRVQMLLSSEDRVRLVSAHRSRSRGDMEAMLHRYLHLQSAERLADLLLRHDDDTIRHLTGVD
jgi:hypothetical protein